MSTKKSWDVRPEPQRKGAAKEKPKARRGRPRTRVATRAAQGRSLKERRERTRNALFGGSFFLFLVLAGGSIFLAWRPEVRIHDIGSDGPRASALSALAMRELSGTYFYVIPRDSIFFYPEHALRKAVLDAFPDISSVAIRRSGLTSLFFKTNARVAAFWWCGTPSTAAANDASCYESDAEGFIFAPVGNGDVLATSTALSTLHIYGELETASSSENYPLRASMKHVDSIPNALRFVRAMNAMNIPIVSLSIHDDEADVFTPVNTRITYVLGHEEEATTLAQATFPTMNLMDGSLSYVDLRFPGKVYLKKKGE